MALRPCYYLFYRLYKQAARWGPRWDAMPQLTALFMMTAIAWCHIYFVIAVIEWRLGHALFPHISKADVVLTYAALMVPLYFWLVYRKRFARIVGQFEGETRRSQLIGGIALWAYFVVFLAASICIARLRGAALGLI